MKRTKVTRRAKIAESKLSVPERHQLKIARDTLKLSDAGAAILGGMSKAEAKAIVNRFHARGN